MSKFATSDYPENPAQATQANEFAELKRLVEGCGLLDKQPAYYTFKILLTLGTFGLGFALLLILDNFALQLLVAVFLAFAYCQVGFVGHDAGHHAIFRSPRLNVMAGLVVNLLISLSQTWWVKQHNQHHRYPNDNELDPHVRLPVLAFSQDGRTMGMWPDTAPKWGIIVASLPLE